MAQFISDFRGPGTRGSAGAGSIQFGINQAKQAQLGTERAQAAQPGLIASDALAADVNQMAFERASLIKGAEDISLLKDRGAQLNNLRLRNQEIISRGGNPEHTQEGIQLLEQGMQTGDFSAFDESIQDILSLREGKQPEAKPTAIQQNIAATGLAPGTPEFQAELKKQLNKPATGQASAKTEILADGTTIQALPSGEVQVRNPSGQVVTGQDRLEALRTSAEFGLDMQQKKADIAVEQARGVAGANQREKRVSDVKTELSARNRNAGRASVRLNQALKVASTATQGIVGQSKLQLAKLFPDIDVGNEALLDQTLKQLAVDQLQNFKGPTTDFEFGIVESTTGSIGDPRTANVARLKSLQRANWFNKREFEQFNRHAESGGDPDTFAFNFGEPVKTKKGVFTLQQIQDTAVSNNLSIEETLKRLNK